MFGTFYASCDKRVMQDVKSYGKERDTYIWFNEEITFYEDIQRMLIEQKSEGNVKFAITSENQPYNSSDVLFPFDKVTSESSFSDRTREYYKKCCRDNMEMLFQCMNKLFVSFHAVQSEIFIVEGYDDNFQKKRLNIDKVKSDLLLQIEDYMSINSCIYYILDNFT